MSWINSGKDRDTVLAAAPKIAEKFAAFYASLWAQGHIEKAALELCRVRLAQLHNATVDVQREEYPIALYKRDNIAKWNTDDAFSASERACLELAEVYAIDPAAITDAQADSIKQHYGDKGLVVLLEALGVFDGMARMSLLWQLEPAGDTQ